MGVRKQRSRSPRRRWALVFVAGAVIGLFVALLTPAPADRTAG